MNTNFGPSSNAARDEWLTPPELIKALGEFDLDPCAPIVRPWPTAKNHMTYLDNGLILPWEGRVFCNPPYGSHTGKWLEKCAMHGNAIAPTIARTETSMFFDYVWNKAHSVFFIRGRLKFYDVSGNKACFNSGAPSVLISFDEYNSEILRTTKIKGKFIKLKHEKF